jgi:hypothetical protein
MSVQSRRRIGTALLVMAGVTGLFYAGSRFIPKLARGMMRRGMQSMMREMMGAGGAQCAPEM